MVQKHKLKFLEEEIFKEQGAVEGSVAASQEGVAVRQIHLPSLKKQTRTLLKHAMGY